MKGGVDEEVPVVNISKQPAIMLLWLLEEACLQNPEKPVTCVNRICLTLGVEVRAWRLQVEKALLLFSI